MQTFENFIKVRGKNAGYKNTDMERTMHISMTRIKNPERLTLAEIKRIRDQLNIPEREMEMHILRILRDELER